MNEMETELRGIREDLKLLLERIEPRLPTVLSFQRAARELDVHPSTLKRMIKAGQIQTVKVNGRKAIPRSELERIATPKAPMPKGGRSRATKHDPKSERAKLGDALKRRR